jgi:Lactate dehydrogenase and related dehydrogenases
MPIIVSLLSQDKFSSSQPLLPAGCTVRFVEQFSADNIIKACEGADCLFSPASAGPIDSFVLENIPSIKIVQTMGVGFDHVDITAAGRLEIPVANVPGANATAVAEHAVGGLIALQRRYLETDAAVKAGNYTICRNKVLREGLGEVRGSRIGLVGFGNIAQEVAKIVLVLGASVSYCATRRKPPELERRFPVEYKPLDELLATNHIISLHIPLTAQTKEMIGARELALMPPGSLLINMARGEIVEPAALAEALETGRLAGAVIDTVAPEPPGADHPLLNLSAAAKSRLLITPHTGGVTVGSYKRMIEHAFQNMARAARGEVPENLVNGIARRAHPKSCY